VKNYTRAVYLELLRPDPLLLNGNLTGYHYLYRAKGARSTISRNIPANGTANSTVSRLPSPYNTLIFKGFMQK